jgi:hypothetical protein
VTSSVVSDRQGPVAGAESAAGDTRIGPWTTPRVARGALRGTRSFAGDAALLLLAVWLFPLIILLIGTPVALFVRLVMAIAERLLALL